jgi:hypothetical protein
MKEMTLLPLPILLSDLRSDEYDTICTSLNIDMVNDWHWVAGKVGLSRREVQIFEKNPDLSAKRFMDDWCAKGATTQQLLKILSTDKKRMDIIDQLSKTYNIP